MAVALGFAVMFATLITLILVPCLYIIMSDVGKVFKALFNEIMLLFKSKQGPQLDR